MRIHLALPTVHTCISLTNTPCLLKILLLRSLSMIIVNYGLRFMKFLGFKHNYMEFRVVESINQGNVALESNTLL